MTGLTDSACPGCGQSIHRTHTCRRSPAVPLSPEERAIEADLEAAAIARCWDVLRAADARRAARAEALPLPAQPSLIEVTP